jgi:BRCT domain type II-containing protein
MSGGRDKELETILKNIGANLSSSVSSNTFALITSDIESGTSKIETAKKHGIPILTPDAFRKKYNV